MTTRTSSFIKSDPQYHQISKQMGGWRVQAVSEGEYQAAAKGRTKERSDGEVREHREGQGGAAETCVCVCVWKRFFSPQHFISSWGRRRNLHASPARPASNTLTSRLTQELSGGAPPPQRSVATSRPSRLFTRFSGLR